MEELMQWIWAHRLWPRTAMRTTDGQRLLVLNPGQWNRDAGPDFFNASVRIGTQQWAGDVEMHVRASDWHRHGHDGDPAYGTVILHVVQQDDDHIQRPDGETIPQLLMRCCADLRERYLAFVSQPLTQLPCGPRLNQLSPLHLSDTLASMAQERLQAKARHVIEMLERCQGSWQTAIYVILARALGFGKNSEPFERLALATPLPFLLKHSDSPVSIEAMLFGQAGLLPETPPDQYSQLLAQEYAFMRAKFGLTPLQDAGWKMARMRPQNLPQRRIALLASMVSQGLQVASRIINCTDPHELDDLFNDTLTGYWATHYGFTAEAPTHNIGAVLGRQSRHTLLINVAAPVMYAYAASRGDYQLEGRAMGLWEQLPAEDNHITRYFAGGGIQCSNAAQSQAVVHLKTQYCDRRKCIYCRLGHRLLSQQVMA